MSYRLHTTQPPTNNPYSTHDLPETFSIFRNLCTFLHKPNPARFADIIHTNNEHVQKLQDEVYEPNQKLTLLCGFPTKLNPLIAHPKILEDSHDQFTKHLASTFRNINRFLTDPQQLLQF